MGAVSVEPVAGKRDFDAFVDFAYAHNASDPNWVPPLRAEVVELLTPGKNPFHEHAKVQLFLARPSRAWARGPATGVCSRPSTKLWRTP